MLFGTGGTFALPAQPVPFVLFADAGAWTEILGPHAVYDGGSRTFVGWVTGNANPNDIVVAAYVDGGGTEGPVLLADHVTGAGTSEPDTHIAPALCINGDGHLVVAWMPHSGTAITVKISTDPIGAGWVAAGFGSPITFTPIAGSLTYAQLAHVTDGDRMWLFFRQSSGGAASLVRCHSDDGGATWSAGTVMYTATGGNLYSAFASNGVDRIDFVVTDGPPEQIGGYGLYHFWMDPTTGDLNAADGSTLVADGDLPAVPSDLTELEATSGGDRFPYSLSYTNDGRPVVAWQTKRVGAVVWGEFRWSGSAWVSHDIDTSDPISPTVLSVGGGCHVWNDSLRFISGKVVSGDMEVWEYTSTDDGATWSGNQLPTVPDVLASPVYVRDNGPDLAAIWFTGTFVASDDFDVGLEGVA